MRAFVLTISHTSRSYRSRADRGMSDPAELPNASWRAQVQPGFGQRKAGSVSGRRGEKCLGWSGSACSRLSLWSRSLPFLPELWKWLHPESK